MTRRVGYPGVFLFFCMFLLYSPQYVFCEKVPLPVQQAVQGQPQFVKQYSTKNCTKESLVGSPISEATGSIAIADHAAVYLSVNGLWGLTSCANESSCSPQKIKSGNGACEALPGEHLHLLKLVRFGDVNQTAKELRIFSLPNFEGSFEILNVTSPAKNFTIRSYYFSGNSSWAIFPTKDFKGSEKCLNVTTNQFSSGFGFQFENNLNFTLGSAKMGPCTKKKNSANRIGISSSYFAVFFAFIYLVC